MTIKPEEMQGETGPIRVDYSAVEYKPEGLTLGCARWAVYGSGDAPRWVRYCPPGQEPVVTIAHRYDMWDESIILARPDGLECEHTCFLPWPGMWVGWHRCEIATDLLSDEQHSEWTKFIVQVRDEQQDLDKQWRANAEAGLLPHQQEVTP